VVFELLVVTVIAALLNVARAGSLCSLVTCRYVELPGVLIGGVLQVESVLSGDEGLYRCVASNDARERTSSDARLTVITQQHTTTGQFNL